MSFSFPFLSVPFLAQKEILKSLSLEDLIFLSTCSKRAYSSVKFANVTLNSIQLKCDEDLDRGINIRLEYPIEEYLYFNVENFDSWDHRAHPHLPRTIMNGVPVMWTRGFWMAFYSEKVMPRIEMIERITTHIRCLFKEKHLDLCLKPGNIEEFFLWKTTRSINILEINSLSETEMKFVKEKLNVEKLKINNMIN